MSGYIALVVRIRSEILVLGLLSCCRFESMFLARISNSQEAALGPQRSRILPRLFPRNPHPNAIKKCSTSNGS